MPQPHLGSSYTTIGVGATEEPLTDFRGHPILFNNIAQERIIPRHHLRSSCTHPYLQRKDGYGGTAVTRLYGA